MSFSRPTFQTIRDRVKSDFRTQLKIATILRRSIEMAFCYAIAGVSHGLHGFIDFLFKMYFWDTSEGNYLIRWASLFSISQEAATQTKFTILITGDEGEVIVADTEWQRSDGEIYTQDDEITLPTAVAGVTQVTDIQTVADVSSSLNSTYFYYDTPDTAYYVWFNVDSAGTDPGINNRTGIEVAISENDSADTVASALQTALNDISGITATVSTDTVTATNDSTGEAEAAVDYTTGFTISVTTTGVDEVIAGQYVASLTSQNTGASTLVYADDSVSLVSPLDNVDSTAVVQEVTQAGEDIETVTSFRSRFLEEVRNPPQGGAATDYLSWMNAMTGVTRSWVLPNYYGMGTVGCTFVNDNADDIFPDDDAVSTVQDALEILAPATAIITVFAPEENSVDMTIRLSPNTAAVRTAVQAELEDLFYREAQVCGAYRYSDETYDGKIALSKIDEAISVATGEDSHELVSPSSTPTPTNGQILTLGTITWQTLT